MAKIFIETYISLQDGRLGHLPLVCNPGNRNFELTIPTNSSTTASMILNVGENIIRCVPRANCGFFFRGWTKDGTELANSVTSPITTLTHSGTEYFCVPHRDHEWYNIKMLIVNDRS